jgi:hypothetical protein
LLGPFFGFFIVGRDDRDAVCYVAIVAREVGVVVAHFFNRTGLTSAAAIRGTAATH